jgi:hypothetical protein
MKDMYKHLSLRTAKPIEISIVETFLASYSQSVIDVVYCQHLIVTSPGWEHSNSTLEVPYDEQSNQNRFQLCCS